MGNTVAPVSLSAQEEEEAEERSRVGGEVLRIVLDFKIALRKLHERKRDATLERCEGKGRLSGGGWHSLALRANKTIRQWGQALEGQGPPEGRVLAVSAAFDHALARTARVFLGTPGSSFSDTAVGLHPDASRLRLPDCALIPAREHAPPNHKWCRQVG